MSKRKAPSQQSTSPTETEIEFCYGVARDLKGTVTVLPIVVNRGVRKALLHGLNEEGDLIGPYDGKCLLEALGIQTWLQASTLTPLKNKEKDKPIFWQRSLLLAVSVSINGEIAGRMMLNL